jgi:GNAT superfamily N-acetyltransferase
MGMNDLIAQGLSFRPIEVADESLLSAIYASTRADEMALVPEWSEADKAAFLEQQFQAQHSYYKQHYPKADFQIILFKGQTAGRLYLDRRPHEFRIVDISLLPALRGQGLGEIILKSILEEAAGIHKPVSIHVERFNKALQLYARLGFRILDDSHAVYLLMEWQPEG